MTSQEADDLRRLVARVKHIHDGTAYLELQNGNVVTYVMESEDDFTLGEVVLIGPLWVDVDTAPSDLWPEASAIGTVRCVLDDEVLVA